MADAVAVAGDSVIIEPALYNTPQPPGRFAHRPMHAFTQLLLDRAEGGTYAFGHRLSMDGEPTLLASLGAHMREAKKVESFGSVLAASFTVFDRIAAKLDQTRFPFVQLQTKLGEPRAEFFQTLRCLAVVLKSDHESSSPGESHPQALTEPDGNLSAHPALIVQTQVGFHVTTR